jgi:signal transduction histidine kinase
MFAQQYPSANRAASDSPITKRLPMASSSEPAGHWEVFVSLWEHANLLRAYCWTQQCGDERALLNQFLVRLRRLFSVDFCFGALGSKDSKLVEFAVPEARMADLPVNLSRRCLDIVANSRAPIAWNDVSGEFGFRSAVVIPVTPPAGPALGFLLLGHTIRRSYTASELFLLQTLAGELSWAVRTLNGNHRLRERLADMSHDIKNSLQLIVGNTEMIRQNTSGARAVDQEKFIGHIVSSVEDILKCMSALPKPLPCAATEVEESDTSVVDIASSVEEAVASCQQLSQERGVKVTVDSAELASSQVRTDPAAFKLALQVLINRAVAATRNETVEFAFRSDETHLRFEIKGMTSNEVAKSLTAMFDNAIRLGGANDESQRALLSVRQYLDQIGGDVYMRSRPGRASEFILGVPLVRERFELAV